jgi:hypothetical protein
MNQIFKQNEFIIVPFYKKGRSTEFMVVNTTKDFKNGHTHVKSYKMAKYLIFLANNHKINSGLRPYLLRSLARISSDNDYIKKVEDLMIVKRSKGKKQSYRNTK